MRRSILIFFTLVALTIFVSGKTFQLDGNDGTSLFRSLADKSSELANPAGRMLNLSTGNSTIQIGGVSGLALFDNLSTNSTQEKLENDSKINLSEWGSKPRKSSAPKYDYQAAMVNQVLRQNHLGGLA